MKGSFIRKVLTISGVLALVFGSTLAYMLSHSMTDNTLLFILIELILVISFVTFVIFLRAGIIRHLATEQTAGVIVRAKEGSPGTIDGASTSSRFWVKYWANGVQYTKKIETTINKQQDLDQHLYEQIIVHYNPNRPKVAWAEVPGRAI